MDAYPGTSLPEVKVRNAKNSAYKSDNNATNTPIRDHILNGTVVEATIPSMASRIRCQGLHFEMPATRAGLL
ncbi:hypothetical protein D9M69_645880 [compost metagenome]